MKGCITFFFALLIAMGLSWALTCGLIYLITLCFAWTFTWPIATGIWLILFLVSSFFRSSNSKK